MEGYPRTDSGPFLTANRVYYTYPKEYLRETVFYHKSINSRRCNLNATRYPKSSNSINTIYVQECQFRAMSTNSLFLPHIVMYHIALAKCYRYVIHNFMWKKKGVRRRSPKSL